LLLASAFALTGILNLVPLASLAAILIATGYKLAKPALFVESAKRGVCAFVPFVATIAGVLATDLLIGIAFGLLCSVVVALAPTLRHPFSMARHGNEFLLMFRKDVTWVIRARLKRRLADLPDRATLIVDASRVDFIDPDVRSLIAEFAAQSAHRGISVNWRWHCQGCREPVWQGRREAFARLSAFAFVGPPVGLPVGTPDWLNDGFSLRKPGIGRTGVMTSTSPDVRNGPETGRKRAGSGSGKQTYE
jgi:hypothetical protein